MVKKKKRKTRVTEHEILRTWEVSLKMVTWEGCGVTPQLSAEDVRDIINERLGVGLETYTVRLNVKKPKLVRIKVKKLESAKGRK